MPTYRAVPRKVVTPVPAAPKQPEDLKKSELVDLAEQRGVDSSGTKAEIIERLSKP
jgi:hypothetical protein